MAARKPRARKPRTCHTPACTLPPDTAFPCDHKLIGRVVPGRNGGTVTACATPHGAGKHAREGQLRTTDGKRVSILRKSVAGRRVRDASRQRHPGQPRMLEEMEAYQILEDSGHHLPHGLELSHVHFAAAARCCPEHSLWARVGALADDTREDLAIRLETLDAGPFERAVLDHVFATPLGREALETETTCARKVLDRGKRRGAVDSVKETRERGRDLAREHGTAYADEVQDYLDQLSPGQRARRARKAGNVNLARKLEREARTGRRLTTFRQG